MKSNYTGVSKWSGTLAIAILTGAWIYMMSRIPTLDFDESLYRSISQAMKLRGDPWLMEWDSSPLFHKPPLLYWLIVATSALLDYGAETVSSLSSRVPSILSSIGILLSLRFGMNYIMPPPLSRGAESIPVMAFLCAGFAVLTSGAVIFDPLQSLALMPALLIPTRIFLRDEMPAFRTWLFFGGSLALATMIKGLNGILIPSLAFGMHLLFSMKNRGFLKSFQLGLRFFALAFLPAALLSAAFFFLLHRKIGPGFTEEFFLVQHFGRSRAPMEAHSGGVLYHPLFILFGGAFLTPVLMRAWKDRRPDLIRFGFPLTYSLAFVLAFTLSATKLPHYTWPAWPALALFAGILHSLRENVEIQSKNQTWTSRVTDMLSCLPVFLLGLLLFTLGSASDLIFSKFSSTSQGRALLSSILPFNGLQKTMFWMGAFSCFVFVIRARALSRNLRVSALLSMIALGSIVFGLGPTLDSAMVRPFQLIAEDLRIRNPAPGDCIRYTGPLSATFSLALGPKLIHNRCDPAETKFLVTPEWKSDECLAAGFTELSRRGHLILCESNP